MNLATWYHQATPATTYLRCELPARYLPGKVLGSCDLHESPDDYWFPDHEGTAVFQFAGDITWALMVHGLQAKGVRVMIESDDNYFTVAPYMDFSGWKRQIGQGPHTLEGHKSIVGWADGCIVTTEMLAKQYRKHNPNVYVCPNTVDPKDWPDIEKPEDGVFRIGWFASSSHYEDVPLVTSALDWASRQKDVEVVTMGVAPQWKFPYRFLGWSDLDGYRAAMSLLDVGIAPVKGSPWAVCRSDIKASEYVMGGAALVLSDQPPYADWTDGENCLKARKPSDWVKAIKHLVRNREETKQLARESRGWVRRNRETPAQIHTWRAAVEGADDVRKAA